jgi:hypothetical protein
MNLQDFVSETIMQIVSGVKAAQAVSAEHGSKVNPKLMSNYDYASQHGFLWCDSEYAQIVQFDVALTATKESGAKGGIGLFVGAVSIGATKGSNSENTSVSRVKFSVPLVLPPQA